MGCNKLSRTQQIPDIFENAGMYFKFFTYYEIFRLSNEDGQGRIIDHSLNLMALGLMQLHQTPAINTVHRKNILRNIDTCRNIGHGTSPCERLSGSAVFWRHPFANSTGKCYLPSTD